VDLDDFQNLRQVVGGHRDDVNYLAVNPVHPIVASCALDKSIRFWDYKTKQFGEELLVKKAVYSIAYSHDGKILAYGTKEGTVGLVVDGKLHGEDKKVATKTINAILFSPNDKEILAGSDELYFLDAATLKVTKKGSGHSSAITHLSISLDGKIAMTNSKDYEILYWDVAKGKRAQDVPADITWESWNNILGWPVQGIFHASGDGTDVNTVAISGKPEHHVSPDHKHNVVATGDDFGQVNLYAFPCMHKKPGFKAYQGHSSFVTCVRFTPGDQFLLSAGGGDLAIIQWRVVNILHDEKNGVGDGAHAPEVHADAGAETQGQVEEAQVEEAQGQAEEAQGQVEEAQGDGGDGAEQQAEDGVEVPQDGEATEEQPVEEGGDGDGGDAGGGDAGGGDETQLVEEH